MSASRTALAGALFLLAAVAIPALAQSPGAVVEGFIAAHNEHDVAAMLALAHPDIEWLSVEGDGVRVETRGAEALGEAMRGYFEAVPTARSSVEAMIASGSRVSVRERAHWESASGPQSQTALSVYEVIDGAIRRVWYFPAE
jgi:hypothetical protein